MSQKPIGWNDKSLKEMLEASEKLFKETGQYYGIDTLKLKEDNPFRFENALWEGELVGWAACVKKIRENHLNSFGQFYRNQLN